MNSNDLFDFLKEKDIFNRIELLAEREGCRVPRDDKKYFAIVIKELNSLLLLEKNDARIIQIKNAIKTAESLSGDFYTNRV